MEWVYYGFLGHVGIDSEGNLSAFMLTPANGSEPEALRDTAPGITGIMLADKGFIGKTLKAELAQMGLDLQRPLRDNMEHIFDPRSWSYWHLKMGRFPAPALPTRRFS